MYNIIHIASAFSVIMMVVLFFAFIVILVMIIGPDSKGDKVTILGGGILISFLFAAAFFWPVLRLGDKLFNDTIPPEYVDKWLLVFGIGFGILILLYIFYCIFMQKTETNKWIAPLSSIGIYTLISLVTCSWCAGILNWNPYPSQNLLHWLILLHFLLYFLIPIVTASILSITISNYFEKKAKDSPKLK